MMAHDHVMKDLEVSTTSGSLIRERILKVLGGGGGNTPKYQVKECRMRPL